MRDVVESVVDVVQSLRFGVECVRLRDYDVRLALRRRFDVEADGPHIQADVLGDV
jgi:hypothetical protein